MCKARCPHRLVVSLLANIGLEWKWGEICCGILSPGGSMGPRYVLQLLFSENSKIANNSATTGAKEKNKHRFGIGRILEIFWCMCE